MEQMTDREKELRFNVKWNRIACYFGIALSVLNAMAGSAFCFVTASIAFFNWHVARLCQERLKEEFPDAD